MPRGPAQSKSAVVRDIRYVPVAVQKLASGKSVEKHQFPSNASPAAKQVQAIFYVDSLDEYVAWLDGKVAERLNGPRVVTGGRNAIIRRPDDGLVVEYFEPSKRGEFKNSKSEQ